jgi:hypothetical protein
MRTMFVLAALAACCGCKSSNIWRPKPDNYFKRSMGYLKSEQGLLPPGRDRDSMGLARDPNAGGLPVF